jgi:hypothetical protein
MAEQLKRNYDLLVLKVELLDTRPNVRFTLQDKVDGVLMDVGMWKSDTSDMGFSPRSRTQRESYQNITGNLPHNLIAGVGKWISTKTNSDEPQFAAGKWIGPLWVHLVKPYGVLRFVPWERALGSALSVPILMLPGFIFPPPRQSSTVLDVALCGSAPLDHEEFWVHEAMREVSRRILEASPRRTRLHIFADSALVPQMRDVYRHDYRLGVNVFV